MSGGLNRGGVIRFGNRIVKLSAGFKYILQRFCIEQSDNLTECLLCRIHAFFLILHLFCFRQGWHTIQDALNQKSLSTLNKHSGTISDFKMCHINKIELINGLASTLTLMQPSHDSCSHCRRILWMFLITKEMFREPLLYSLRPILTLENQSLMRSHQNVLIAFILPNYNSTVSSAAISVY